MGNYSFELQADTVAKLWLDDYMVVNKKQYQLVAGAHNIRVDYFCGTAATKKITLKYCGPDTNEDMIVIPAAVLHHDPKESYMVEKPGFIAEYFPGDFSDERVAADGATRY